MFVNKFFYNYFLLLFFLIPITILLGSAILVFNILLIDLSFLILIVIRRDFSFLKSKPIIYLFALYIYLIFNSFISIEFSEGLLRNFGFLRMIIFFAALNYFFLDKSFSRKVFKFWLIIMLIVIFDVFLEFFFGENILGYNSGMEFNNRIVSFFKDEQIVGSYLFGFYLILLGFIFYLHDDRGLIIKLLIISLFLLAIFFTGERATSIKTFLGTIFFLLSLKNVTLKKKIIFITIITTLIITTLSNSSYLKMRFVNQIKSAITITYLKDKNHPESRLGTNDTVYYELYRSGYEVFRNNKSFGVGNKNYRVEACKEGYRYYYCSTHPHQIYFELLSEHGIFGTIILLFIFYKLIFSKFILNFKESNYLRIGSLIYLLLVFMPLIPSGAFFNNLMITFFMINLSIYYAKDINKNIFMKNI